MAEIIVVGHGTYPEGIRTNLEMVVGVPAYMHFVNFSQDMSRGDLEDKLAALVAELAGEQILFCVDLPGATPFQVCALQTAADPANRCTVVGLNNMAYMEMAMDAQDRVQALAARAADSTRESLVIFPEANF